MPNGKNERYSIKESMRGCCGAHNVSIERGRSRENGVDMAGHPEVGIVPTSSSLSCLGQIKSKNALVK